MASRPRGSHLNGLDRRNFGRYALGCIYGWQRPYDPVLVACMGDLFAVAASCEVGYKFSENGQSVATQLHIFKLAEEGRLLETLQGTEGRRGCED